MRGGAGKKLGIINYVMCRGPTPVSVNFGLERCGALVPPLSQLQSTVAAVHPGRVGCPTPVPVSSWGCCTEDVPGLTIPAPHISLPNVYQVYKHKHGRDYRYRLPA